jgi:hypothetical protein
MKARMRDDLLEALKAKRTDEVAVLRCLLAAIDNAEAPAIASVSPAEPTSRSGASAEIERLLLTQTELGEVVRREREDRERAAGELASLGQRNRADALLRQAVFVGRYLA